jgi:hypothetical protein
VRERGRVRAELEGMMRADFQCSPGKGRAEPELGTLMLGYSTMDL